MTLRLGSLSTDQSRRRRHDFPGFRVSLRSVRVSVNLMPRKAAKAG